MSSAAASRPDQPEGIDLICLDTYQQTGPPHEQFKQMREQTPVFWHHEPDGRAGFWAVLDHELIKHVSKTPADFSCSIGGTNIEEYEEEDMEPIRMLLINMDPPIHVKYRKLISRGFTPRMVRVMEPHVRKRVIEILDRIEPMGECDFVTEVAAELPLQVLAELIGIPQEDRSLVFDWSNRLIGFDDPEFSTSLDDARMASMEIWVYTQGLVDARLEEGGEGDDLIRVLLNAEVEGDKLTEADLNAFFLLLSVAGNETTRNAITGGLLALMENPDQMQRLRENPELIDTAVEEIIRWVVPVNAFRRTATRDLELGGANVKEGDKVVMFYHAANRDPNIFDNATSFDVGREDNPHLSFGYGEHFCIGASLARLEIKVLFEELLKRFSSIEQTGPIKRLRSNFINGIKTLPVKYTV